MVMSLMSNPKGAVGTVVVAEDGSGDTTDIQTGIDMLPAAGGCVYIKEGIYTIDVPINVPAGAAIKGCGYSTQITTNNAINIFQDNFPLFITIEDLYINGNNVALAGISFTIDDGHENHIRGVWIDDCQDGIVFGIDINLSVISGNFITGSSRYGIHIYDGSENRVINNYLTDCDSYAIYCDDTSLSSIMDNIIFSSDVGIYCQDSTSLIIKGNNIFNSVPAIYFENTNLSLISGNITGRRNIVLDISSRRNLISNNNLWDFAAGGYGEIIDLAGAGLLSAGKYFYTNQIFNNYDHD